MKVVWTLIFSLVSSVAMLPVDQNYPLETIEPDCFDKASLQRGLATAAHYCMGCHSLSYQRYERTASDLGIDTDVMVQTIVPSDQKIGDLGKIMPSKVLSGSAPPLI